MRYLYNLFVFIYYLTIRFYALFNVKARKWVKGRGHYFSRLKEIIPEKEKLLWIHCASLGEFEQGRPVMEALRVHYPDHKILLTFFSPSGYDIRKNYQGADYVFYLPIDTRRNAKKFVRITNPRMAFFIKYEFWYNYINELSKNKIPLIFISTAFRRSQYFFYPWGKWARKQLQKVTWFFVQNQDSLDLLNRIRVYHADVGGDTRFDRVVRLAGEYRDIPKISHFKNNLPLIVAGSTWPADEDVLLELLKNSKDDFKLLIAPHEIHKEHINELTRKFSGFQPLLFSQADTSSLLNSRVLIIDNIGLLSHLYRYGTLAYIGGGFGAGIHNILEAATYNKPVIFGPNYHKFIEAKELLESNGAFVIHGADELSETVKDLLNNKEKYDHASQTAGKYVKSNTGATRLVIDKVAEFLVSY
ncbi:MAG: 3-deoxy-D-manno-octulosonic acid transferase [Chlorobi bacterium]|nr:3-deoxy-D-manno-octulosonic acid transferase [Chlorobiota bacterium]